MSKYNVVVSELCQHLKDLASEAERGDPDAQTWLLAGFPGHREHLARCWGKLTLEQQIDAKRRRAADLTSELTQLQHDLAMAVGAQRAQRSHHLWEQMVARNTALDAGIAERESSKRAEQAQNDAAWRAEQQRVIDTKAEALRLANEVFALR